LRYIKLSAITLLFAVAKTSANKKMPDNCRRSIRQKCVPDAKKIDSYTSYKASNGNAAAHCQHEKTHAVSPRNRGVAADCR